MKISQEYAERVRENIVARYAYSSSRNVSYFEFIGWRVAGLMQMYGWHSSPCVEYEDILQRCIHYTNILQPKLRQIRKGVIAVEMAQGISNMVARLHVTRCISFSKYEPIAQASLKILPAKDVDFSKEKDAFSVMPILGRFCLEVYSILA